MNDRQVSAGSDPRGTTWRRGLATVQEGGYHSALIQPAAEA